MASLNPLAPKIGIVSNSIGVYSEQGKAAAETQMRDLLESLKKEGAVDPGSLFLPKRIFGPTEALEAADRFVEERVDGMVVLDSAFPNGNAFLTFAAHPRLSRIPLILSAPPEIERGDREWTTNAYCGLLMNNYVAKHLDRPVFPLAGWPGDAAYRDEFRRLARVIGTIREMGRELLGRFGDAPGGFHCASGNRLAYAKCFGTRVETIDLTAVFQTYHSGKAEGYRGQSSFAEADVDRTCEKMLAGREVRTAPERVRKAARLYHALAALIEANGFTSAAVRCWPEIMQVENISACLSLGWLLSEGVVRAAACEGDWPTAVTQSMATLLSGKPAACLDFINQVGARPVVQLAHCGVGIPCVMQEAVIGEISPDRQGGVSMGPTCIGQFEYGVKTGIVLTQDPQGAFKMLVFTGESRADTQQNILCAAADVEVSHPERLNRLILEHGFPHHLAVALGDIRPELKRLCEFYRIGYVSPDEE